MIKEENDAIIKYRIFDSGRGFIVTRRPVVQSESVRLRFEGLPDGTTVMIERGDGMTIYKKPVGYCVDVALKGEETYKVTASLFDTSARPERWACEGIRTENLQDGTVLVMPDDNDLPDEVIRLREDNEDLRRELNELKNKTDEMKDMIERIMEGHDIV